MNDVIAGEPNQSENGDGERVRQEVAQALRNIEPPASHAARSSALLDATERQRSTTDAQGRPANEKSDSEAETVVLSVKGDSRTDQARKTIKHESVSDGEPSVNADLHSREGSKKTQGNGALDLDRPSLKRKRTTQGDTTEGVPEGGNSSNLSSTISSPALELQSSRRSESGSDRSRSSPPCDEAAPQNEGRSRKRKLVHDGENHTRQQRGKSDPSSEHITGSNQRGNRNPARSAAPVHRSESPPLPIHKRAPSIQSNRSESYGGSKRRRAPPTLHVERRRKASEDTHDMHGESDDSSSVHSHPYLQRFTSTDHNALSPAKMSHKKNRDKNGRTLLARACALDDVEAELRLRERPQDLNIPDNAGNSPLQIASLEGKSKIVQLLLAAGCDITCKNIDSETPLIDAVENGHLEVVQMLLGAGLDPRQSNAKGEEPLDLVNPENDHYDAIRAALISAKEKDKIRRPSEDHSWQQNITGRENDISATAVSTGSPVDALPVHGMGSPPIGLGTRRRTARSQPTRDGLLWVNATPENLREAAGKGDLTIVDHILKMRPEADSESVLAAARGGHEIVLELLIAIGRPNPDPDPLRSSDYKPAHSTPMLAAIGRGHVNVIELLLNQPGFDPTRRLYKGLAYHEIAKERQSSEWQDEYKVLKEAYDTHINQVNETSYVNQGLTKVTHGSVRKVRPKYPESHKSISDVSSSPLPNEKKKRHSEPTVLDDSKKGINRDSQHQTAVHKHPRVSDVENREIPSLASDRESEPLGPPKPKPKGVRSVSDVGSEGFKHAGVLKPRRKLLSRNDLNSDQDTRRRASLAEASTGLSQENLRRESTGSVKSQSKIKTETSKERIAAKGESGKKRSRLSESPQAKLADVGSNSDVIKKKKRRRAELHGNTTAHDQPRPGALALVAKMIAPPEPQSSSNTMPGTAPVAFMGTSITSPIVKSPESLIPKPYIEVIKEHMEEDKSHAETSVTNILNSSSPGIHQSTHRLEIQKHNNADKDNTQRSTSEFKQEDQSHRKEEVDSKRSEPRARHEAEEARAVIAAKAAAEEKLKAAREEEKLRLESQRQAEEAERQLQVERAEEEARELKKQQESEVQAKRAEQQRVREQQELEAQKRAEIEERERLKRVRAQEEAERQRRESLPGGLRRAAELSPAEVRTGREITRWLPLHTLTTRELDPSCDEQIADERWVANVQAAPILCITDLDLPQRA